MTNMNSIQYEEFCRFFLSLRLNIEISEIQSVNVPNPKRPGFPEYKHQIDLYWEDGNELATYINIANAKWRSKSKVDQPDVLLLQQVKTKVSAHKAVMLTNVGFTQGAQAAAQDEGIALHVVTPNFDYTNLPDKDRIVIQKNIQEQALSSTTPIWNHEAHYKTIENFAVEIPNNIKEILTGASDGERFMVKVLFRRLEYLKWVIRLIEAGTYGNKEDIPSFTNEIRKTNDFLDETIKKIKGKGPNPA